MGHYFSVIKPAIDGCTVLVANYHAPEEKSIEENIEILQKFGVNNILLQKDVFEPDLFFRLLNLVSIAELERMPQFKAANNKSKTAQLLTYPVLMTHDIVGYREIYVGEDQIPHIDFARKLIKRYDEKEMCPTPIVTKAKIRDLRKTSFKMSKSSPQGCLFLDDSNEDISKKLRKATMDEEGVENLRFLYAEFVKEEMPTSYGEAKANLSERLGCFLDQCR